MMTVLSNTKVQVCLRFNNMSNPKDVAISKKKTDKQCLIKHNLYKQYTMTDIKKPH